MTSSALRKIILAAAGVAAFSMSGCVGLASFATNVATSLSSSTPSQVTTLAEAEQAATLVTKAADVAVNTGKLNTGTLKEINALSDAVHAAIDDLEAANANGKSLNYAAFNAALKAYNAFMTSSAIPH